LDPFVQQGGALLTQGIDKLMDTDIAIYDVPKQNFIKEYGTLGISVDRLDKLWSLGNLAATGKYTDDYGKEKQISQQDMEALRPLVPLALATDVGLAPVEFNSGINNAVKFVKKKTMSKEEIEEKESKAYDKQEAIDNKVDALIEIRDNARNPKEEKAAQEKIDELETSDKEELKQLTEERKEEREQKSELLTDEETGTTYDNVSDLKRYNPRLWRRNFGPKSDWYKEHREEIRVEKELNKKLKEEKDKEYGYKKRPRNADGTIKSSSSYKSYGRSSYGGKNYGRSSRSERWNSDGTVTTTTRSSSGKSN
jgi:hypothetical protein